MFEVGGEVEVSFVQSAYRDAWFKGTILKDLGNGRFLTKYCNSDDNNKTKPLIIPVDSRHIRPSPPVIQDKRFVLLEKVDAYFNFGWWSGVITTELENNSYLVFFKHTGNVMEFRHSELRPHMEWKDGKWLISQPHMEWKDGKWLTSQLSQGVSVLESTEVTHKQHTHENLGGTSVFVPLSNSGNKNDSSVNKRNHQFEQLTSPVSEKPSRSVAKKRMNLSDLSDVVSLLPKKPKEGNVVEAIQHDKHSRSSSKSLSGCVSPGSVGNMISFGVQSAADRSSGNSLSGDRTTKQGNVGSATRIDDIVNATTGSMQSTLQVLQAETPEPILGGNEGVAAVRDTVADNIQHGGGGKQSERHVIIGLPCAAETTGLTDPLTRRGERALRSITKQLTKHVNDQIHQLDNDSTTKKLKEDSKLSESVRRKRGRPRKNPPKILHIPIAGSARNGEAESDTKNDGSHAFPHVLATSPNQGDNSNIFGKEDKLLADGETNPKNRSITGSATLAKMLQHETAASSDSVRLGQESSNETGRTKSVGEHLMPQVDGSFNVSGTKEINVDSNGEVVKVVTEAPNNEIDYEPVTASPIHDGSVTSPMSTVEQSTEERLDIDTVPEEENAKQTKNGKEASPPLIEKGSVNRSEQQGWLKHSVLWKTIESMDVFQRIPQNPHFEPLNSLKESSREGLAIGYMVTFSSVVGKTYSLQFNDDKSVMDEILETLEDLEKQGFDVRIVRDRITGLLSLKNNQGKLVEEVDELNSQILEHSHVKSRMDEEIRETSEKIRKLQEKLSAAEAAKEKENGEINSLQGKLIEAEQRISSVMREFESLASSSLQ